MPRIEQFTKIHEMPQPEPGNYLPIPELGEFIQVRGKDRIERVLFSCPCGCGGTVSLRVVPAGQPHERYEWEYMANGHLIYPSVRDMGRCYAHYNIRADGGVTWHGDTGQKTG